MAHRHTDSTGPGWLRQRLDPVGEGHRETGIGGKLATDYVAPAKADFAKTPPGGQVEFVAQPFDQYYTLLGAAIQAKQGR